MAEDPRARSDGVTIAPGHRPGKARLALAGAAAIAALAVFALFRTPAPASDPQPAQLPAVASAPPELGLADSRLPPAHPAPERSARPAPARDEAAPVDEPAPQREATSGGDEIGDARTPSGIALFPPRGSDPVRVGLVVPDDFELPEGFVRHYQVTDDGQELPPILVVHPDYELLDAQGNPVPRPEGGVVPPELAPPGMPIETLVVPEPPDESGP
jgi:hypothetical protein